MLGKTHMAVGIATTLAVLPPENTRQLLLEVGAGAVGALISDIDVGTSESHRDADKITYLTLGVIAAVIALDHFMNTGIVFRIRQSAGTMKLILGILMFVGIGAYGKGQPHRFPLVLYIRHSCGRLVSVFCRILRQTFSIDARFVCCTRFRAVSV